MDLWFQNKTKQTQTKRSDWGRKGKEKRLFCPKIMVWEPSGGKVGGKTATLTDRDLFVESEKDRTMMASFM